MTGQQKCTFSRIDFCGRFGFVFLLLSLKWSLFSTKMTLSSSFFFDFGQYSHVAPFSSDKSRTSKTQYPDSSEQVSRTISSFILGHILEARISFYYLLQKSCYWIFRLCALLSLSRSWFGQYLLSADCYICRQLIPFCELWGLCIRCCQHTKSPHY